MNLPDMAEEGRRLSILIDKGLEALRDNAQKVAEAEQAYRIGKLEQWARVKNELPKATVPEKQAWVDAMSADLRYERDLADGMRQAALEAVRSRRTQLSACQSMLAAHTAEASFDRTGPR